MLNISSSSWHYRLRSYAFDHQPKDLCSYFWSVIAAACLYALVHIVRFSAWAFGPMRRQGRLGSTMLVLIGMVLVLAACFLIGWAAYEIWIQPWAFFVGLLQVIAIILVIAVVAALAIFFIFGTGEIYKRYRKSHPVKPHRREVVEEPEGESSFMLIWNFLKAKKRKACPLVSVDGTVHIKDRDHLKDVEQAYQDIIP